MGAGAYGKIVTGVNLGTTAAMNIAIGFVPRFVKVVNANTGANVEWWDSMTAGDGLLAQDHADAQFSLETSGCITAYTGLAARGALTGTAAVTAASQTVTGTSTNFLVELAVGDVIEINGESRVIGAIASDTSLTVTDAFDASASGKSILAVKGRPAGFTIGTNSTLNTAHNLYWVAMG